MEGIWESDIRTEMKWIDVKWSIVRDVGNADGWLVRA